MNKICLAHRKSISTLNLGNWKRGFIKNYWQRVDQSLGKTVIQG